MIEADKMRFTQMLGVVAESFEKELTDGMARGYWAALQDLPMAEVTRAMQDALKTCEYMPRPANIRKLAGRAELGSDHRAALAWQAVRAAIARHGTYKSVDFDDPIVNCSIRNLGGWVALGQKSAEDFDIWTRKEFERIYQTIALSGASEDDVSYLPGISESQNTGLYPVEPPVKINTHYEQGTFKVRPSLKLDTNVLKKLEGMGRGQDQHEAQGEPARAEDKASA